MIQVHDAQVGQVGIRYVARWYKSCLVLGGDELTLAPDAVAAGSTFNCKFERERASTSLATSSPYCSANWLVGRR